MKPGTVDEYLAALPDERRRVMQTLREAVRAGAPEATEAISYGMPALKSHGGRFLVSYDAFKAHYSLFPSTDAVIEGCGQELTPYLSGKGTIRFAADQPLPVDLITRIVEIRFQENAARPRR